MGLMAGVVAAGAHMDISSCLLLCWVRSLRARRRWGSKRLPGDGPRQGEESSGRRLLHFMICHTRKRHRPRTSSCYKKQQTGGTKHGLFSEYKEVSVGMVSGTLLRFVKHYNVRQLRVYLLTVL